MLFGSPPGLGVAANTDMAKEISEIFSVRYEKKFFTLHVPSCFDDLFSKDANIEMVASNTIQPLRLTYCHNTVTFAIGIIFINYTYIREEAVNAKKLLLEELGFNEVNVYVCLSKGQIIEKMNLLQCRAE